MNRLVDKQKLLMGTSTDQTLIKTTPDPIDKKMIDSYVEEYLAFKSDPDVLAEYINVYGLIRFGKILEDLDALAGSISYAFADDGRSDTPPLTIVTASLDRIDLLEPITASEDVRLSGFVTSVGTSSMEVSIIMEIVPEGVEAALAHSNSRQQPPTLEEWVEARKSSRTLLAAKFTMVGRDQVTGKAAPINRLKLETSLERKLNERGIRK